MTESKPEPEYSNVTVIQFRIKTGLLGMIHELAEKKGLKYQELMRMILTEGVMKMNLSRFSKGDDVE